MLFICVFHKCVKPVSNDELNNIKNGGEEGDGPEVLWFEPTRIIFRDTDSDGSLSSGSKIIKLENIISDDADEFNILKGKGFTGTIRIFVKLGDFLLGRFLIMLEISMEEEG